MVQRKGVLAFLWYSLAKGAIRSEPAEFLKSTKKCDAMRNETKLQSTRLKEIMSPMKSTEGCGEWVAAEEERVQAAKHQALGDHVPNEEHMRWKAGLMRKRIQRV